MSRATEDYLKAVYHLGTHGDPVTTGLLASELGVSSPSVSAMVKRLEDGELLHRADGRSIRLTDAGEREALRVIRRHRLLETFLAQALDVPWDEVHAEAELLEHALSSGSRNASTPRSGIPPTTPTVTRSPRSTGPHSESWGVSLESVAPGSRFRVERVSDRDSAALRHLGGLGLIPGTVLDVEEQEPFGGPYWVRIDGARHALGIPLTRLVHGPNRGAVVTTTGDRQESITEIRERGGIRSRLIFFGPAFVAAIAYVDPGNFATNFSAGAQFGYLLLWVIVGANLLAMLIQTLSAKLGMATGRNLPEMCREQFPKPVTRVMWVQAELVAIATDLAEVIGGAIALNLLFGIPLFTGGVITGIVAFLLLALQNRGYRPFELAIAGLFGVILIGFLVTVFRIEIPGAELASGLIPRFDGTDSLLLATGILGATVMPHVIYLHSALTQNRIPAVGVAERKFLLRRQQTDVLVGMGLAGLVNAAMLVIAAALFFGTDVPDTDTLEGVHAGLARVLDQPAAFAFALALLASGFASSGVGTYAGQVVMQGFIRRSIPLLVRRLLTLAPALVVLGIGFDPTRALVLSQVVLSFGIPFALVPLVMLTRRKDIMAELVNRRTTTVVAAVAAALIIGLNVFLIVQTVTGA